MTKCLFFALLFLPFFLFAQAPDSASNDSISSAELDRYLELGKRADSIRYSTGPVILPEGIKLNVPPGYKFISQKDAEWLVFDFWGNPRNGSILGIIVKDDYQVMDGGGWAFVVTFDKMGYVKDDDAADINYDDLLNEIRKSEEEENKERVKEGYGAIHMLGWASKPYYDSKEKVLHWAKSLKFGDNQDTTLNYDVRVLGRYGVLSMNAVGVISDLPDIKANIPQVLTMARFSDGYAYKDFDSKMDEVAAVTIGGLVAGKLLAKAGILALLLKNIKLILIAAAGAGGAIWKRISGKKKPAETGGPEEMTGPAEPSEPAETGALRDL